MSDADDLVNRYVLNWFRDPDGAREPSHLQVCAGAVVETADARNGSYGCETGCNYVQFEAVITCPHGQREAVGWGQFGDLAGILEELERLEAERASTEGSQA